MDTDDQEQLTLIQGAIAAYQADPLVQGLSFWQPNDPDASAESGTGAGYFTNGANFRRSFIWLINNVMKR